MTPDEQIVTELLYMVKREAARRRKEAMMHGGEAGDRLEEVIFLFLAVFNTVFFRSPLPCLNLFPTSMFGSNNKPAWSKLR